MAKLQLRSPSGQLIAVKKRDIITVIPPDIGQTPGTWDEEGEYVIPAAIVLAKGVKVGVDNASYQILRSKGF